ncbi:MAG: response regulator transcription factor [Lentisphaeria bacterium]|nr:response regulator transcription factor [Lentisphaeria bacterium]
MLKGLKQAGFTTVHAEDGKTGLFKAKTEEFDLAVIDIMLPVMDGFSVIEKIRAAKITTPIIILSAKNAVEDKIRGLQLGSDDYLAKPFSFSELLARIQALLRRANTASDPTTLTVADLTIDLLSHRVTRGNVRIDIQPLEFQLLEYLVRNTGRVVSKTMIMEHVWEYNFDPQTNVVEARVCRLRDKIDKPFERKLIHTVRGFGYVLE